MQSKPLVTIITVVFNSQNTIEKTIESVINQTYTKYEYIIIDGGSTDNTLKIISKYYNSITKIISEKDYGIYDAMNKGIALAKGKWINFLNAGDIFSDIKTLEAVSNASENYINCNLLYLDYKINNILYSPILNLNFLIKNMICHQSLFYHKSLFIKYNYDTNLELAADYKHLLKIWPILIPFKISSSSITYEGGGISSNNKKRKQLYQERCESIINSNIGIYYKALIFTYNFILKHYRN